MANVKILPSDTTIPELNSHAPEIPASPLSFALEEGGEAFFRIPTVKDLKTIERQKPRLSLTDKCRELAKSCLVSWGDRPQMPDEDDIDAADDLEMVRLFLRQMTGTEDADDLDETDLINIYQSQADSIDAPSYEVLEDRSHRVKLPDGDITFRRMTRKDLRRLEADADKSGSSIIGDVLIAVSTCTAWWRTDRPIMPADFDPIPLKDFRRVAEALTAFLKKSPRRPD